MEISIASFNESAKSIDKVVAGSFTGKGATPEKARDAAVKVGLGAINAAIDQNINGVQQNDYDKRTSGGKNQ